MLEGLSDIKYYIGCGVFVYFIQSVQQKKYRKGLLAIYQKK